MNEPVTVPRRRLLSRLLGMLALVASPVLRPAAAQPRATLEPTPRDAEGPFYPTRIPAEADADLTRVPGRSTAAKGTPLALSGRVLGIDGNPLAGAKLELWQCDALGRYHHVDGDPGTRDENFQGYGVTSTDSDGRFAFRTIRPVPYGGRPPHLHFKLAHPTRAAAHHPDLSARRIGGARFRASACRLPKRARRLEFGLKPAQAGTLTASYDFVLRSAG